MTRRLAIRVVRHVRVAVALLVLGLPLPAQAAEIVVFAAASLKTALDTIAATWEATSDDEVLIAYAGTPALARQIIAGAPADIFIAASADWMDAVDADGRLTDGTRRDLLGNRLVLVGPAGSKGSSEDVLGAGSLESVVEASKRMGGAALAMAFVDAVPAGLYGKAALVSLGRWEELAAGVVETENVRAALALVARGEVPFGVVYASDVVAEPRVAIIGRFPSELHAPIVYPAALMTGASPSAEAFFDYLSEDAASAVFEAAGFVMPQADP